MAILELMSLLPQSWSLPIRQLPQRMWRLWSSLPWGRRLLALGAVLIMVELAARFIPGIWRAVIDAAMFATYYGTVLVSGFPRIKTVKDRATRIALRWAFPSAAAGTALVLAGVLVFIYAPRLGTRFGVLGSVLLLASIAIFGLASGTVDAIGVLGLAAGVIVSSSLLVGVFVFPPIIVFLLSSGQWPRFLLGPQANSGWIDLIATVPLAVLCLIPDVVRKYHKWEDASPKARIIVSGWIASVALAFTCGYAVALHFSPGNPLAATSLPGIALAIIFVGVIIWPLYRNVSASFWRLGIAEAVKLKNWRSDQKEARKEVQKAWRESRTTHDRQAKTKADAALSNPSAAETERQRQADTSSCLPAPQTSTTPIPGPEALASQQAVTPATDAAAPIIIEMTAASTPVTVAMGGH
jgi:hypothetical protein